MRPVLLVLTSTYPRWEEDPEPGFVHELCRRLTDRFEVHVLCPHAPGAATRERMDGVEVHRYRYAPAFLETLVQDGGILANLRHRRWKWFLLPAYLCVQTLATARLLRDLRPRVVHAHWLVAQGLTVAVLKSFGMVLPPVLLTSHGGDLFGLRAAPLRRIKRAAIDAADAVTVVSSAARDAALELGARPGKVDVLPMGVDFERFSHAIEAPRRTDELLFVGRLVEKKGLDVLIRALPRVLRAHPGVSLTVVGYGPQRDSLEALANECGVASSVCFLGPLPQGDLPDLYRRASVFVAPFIQAPDGDREGLGLVTIEALACGCPAVVAALPAVLDVIDPGECAQMLFHPGDEAELAQRLDRALSDPEAAQASARQMLDRLRERFEWSRVAERYAVRIESLAQSRGDAA